ncbi:hypothetical protein RBB78_02800 [Tunturiibacter empetritectus]|uniref:hypothetical protein n=1 Tax=Tunturiibacter empetritectus TaxID=3069691 RepID=UPI003D9ACC58
MSNRSTSKKIAKLANDLLLLCLISFAATRLHAQALPTATSAGVLQAGGEFNYANSDYVPQKIKGGGAYVNFDFKYHWGIEAEFHQINDPNPNTNIYERTYEIGPRYVLHFGRIEPFAKVMYGRGVFQYPEVPSLTPGGPRKATPPFSPTTSAPQASEWTIASGAQSTCEWNMSFKNGSASRQTIYPRRSWESAPPTASTKN